MHKLFIGRTDLPIVKRGFMVLEQDHELVRNVFPEPGFVTYYPGFCVSLLAKELRKYDITDPTQRTQYHHLAGVPGLVSSLGFTLSPHDRDDR